MEIVAVINYKGGVGKTTVTANLAGELGKVCTTSAAAQVDT